jgi:hypothetical protein
MNQTTITGELLDVLRRDRLRRSRWRRFGTFLGRLATALLSGFVSALLSGWTFMLAVGAIHQHWLPQVPTLGYWWAVLIAWLLRSSLSAVSPTKTAKAEQ